MPRNNAIAIKTGNFLYRHCFRLYDILYPIMKNRQDAHEIKLLRQSVAPGDIVLDIGANIGFFSRKLSEAVGEKGHVYAFEPDDTNCGHLKKAVRPLANITVRQAAVGDTDGKITLFKSPMLNVDHRTYPIDDYTSTIEVDCLTIDNFLPESTPVSFIKMDIQGFEYAALKGMKNTLIRNRDKLRMLMELWPAGLKKAGSSASELITFLEACGYHASLTENGRLSPVTVPEARKLDGLGDDFYFNIFVSAQP
jgi:FkbM family methyltransferase